MQGTSSGVQFHPEKSHQYGARLLQNLRNCDMLRLGTTPCLLIRNGGLVKTVQFRDEKYVGDPINAVRIFNEKEADEFIVLDIDALATGADPNFRLISQFAVECRMPPCYGGGIKTAEQAKKTIGLWVEKVVISAAAIENPRLISAIAHEVGNQSVVVFDGNRCPGGPDYKVKAHNARTTTGKLAMEAIRQAEPASGGQIVSHSIAYDGRMRSCDLTFARIAKETMRLPMTMPGGAGTPADLGKLSSACGGAGGRRSLFVFSSACRAASIRCPTSTQDDGLIPIALSGSRS
jgi:cyclase